MERSQTPGYWLPNPLRCFLLEPRPGMPEENLPNPVTLGRPCRR
jgi:hypothetical protein